MPDERRIEESARKILEYFNREIKNAPCSEKHHLNVRGGLLKHLENVFLVADKYFSDNQLIFLALIHDIGKARVYTMDKNGVITYKSPNIDHIIHTITMLNEYGIKLTDEELNAIQFHHGGWSNFKGDMTELAIKLHFCDMIATVVLDNK